MKLMISESCCWTQGPEGRVWDSHLDLKAHVMPKENGTYLPDVFAAWEYGPYSISSLERVWKFLRRLLKIVECWQPVKVKNKQSKPLAQPRAK